VSAAGRSIHDVPAGAYHHVWDNAIEPVLSIASGEEVLCHVRDASDEQLDRNSDAEAVAGLDFSHVNPVSGPVEVRGASPGAVLQVDILELAPSGWGWTALIPGFGLLADEFPDPWLRISELDGERVRFGERITLPFQPFPGTIGVALPEPGEHPIVPPSDWGGNMDIKHLCPGTTLYLPVGVEGARFSVGDTHAAMGDGEVCGTAVETAMDITVRLTVRRDLRLSAPQYHIPEGRLARTETSSYHVCTGVASDLMEAARRAVRAMIEHLGEHYELGREEAYALASVACDLRIHEVVDAPNWVVGVFLPEDVFGPT
jgi:acetamidase/formamidase